MELSIIIPALNEVENLAELIPTLKNVLIHKGIAYEIIVVDGGSKDSTPETVRHLGAQCIVEPLPGYGRALLKGFAYAKGSYILTLDADFSHEPSFIESMWRVKDTAELVIASRYVQGGKSKAPLIRRFLSIVLNNFFSAGWSIPLKDVSSGFRLYRRQTLNSLCIEGTGYNILPEIAIKIYAKGRLITEIPFIYNKRKSGSTHVKLIKFWFAYLKTFLKMWYLRNSITCADYDFRAYYSKIPLQRYWQRKRYKIVRGFIEQENGIVDIGCGSSKIIVDLPNAIGVDLNFDKLLFLRRFRQTRVNLINATISKLPFKDGAFSSIVCSEVIEHTEEPGVFDELSRVLKNKGVLILGTPDYDRISWRIFEKVYGLVHEGGYADTHVNHYTFQTLKDTLIKAGFTILDFKYILGSELIVKAQKVN